MWRCDKYYALSCWRAFAFLLAIMTSAILGNTVDRTTAISKLFIYVLILVAAVFGYCVYLYMVDPLAKHPGPFLARVSNLWRVYHTWNASLPDRLLELHKKHGPVIRIGPNDLDFNEAAAVKPIYKAGRSMPKSDFYDGFTAFKANLFGTRDEDVCALIKILS